MACLLSLADLHILAQKRKTHHNSLSFVVGPYKNIGLGGTNELFFILSDTTFAVIILMHNLPICASGLRNQHVICRNVFQKHCKKCTSSFKSHFKYLLYSPTLYSVTSNSIISIWFFFPPTFIHSQHSCASGYKSESFFEGVQHASLVLCQPSVILN